MDRRFPFDSQGRTGQNPLHNAQMRAALGLGQLDETLYLQQDLQRDLRLRQMLFAGQLDQRNRLGNILQEQQLKAMDQFPELQHYRLLMNDPYQLHGEQSLHHPLHQEELRRRAQLSNASALSAAAAATQPALTLQSPSTSKIQAGSLNAIAADVLTGNAMKRDETVKRLFAKADNGSVTESKKRPRSDLWESAELKKDQKRMRNEGESSDQVGNDGFPSTLETNHATAHDGVQNEYSDKSQPSVEALLHFSAATTPQLGKQVREISPSIEHSQHPPTMAQTPTLGTLNDLLSAGQNVKKTDDAATTLMGIMSNVDWPDSESEESADAGWEERQALRKGDTIQLPNFNSVLPQLPEEPEAMVSTGKSKKHKFLLDDDPVEGKHRSKPRSRSNSRSQDKEDSEQGDSGVVEYPFPIDTWWPSADSVRQERKKVGEIQYANRYEGSEEVLGKDSPFQIDVEKCRDVLSTQVAPGKLEKVLHCSLHRMCMRKKKNPSAPELCHCFQVTELYPNEPMVCCSVCGTWRHAACGGHYKPYSVRECIDTPFVPVCDRCHAEKKLLQDYPLAQKRIDRQRTEQIRRGLSTSAAMRQASFSKHGGTYKWPLGSVSATHIGGHTRSVHSRHDKAEKQWMDMATRLGRRHGYRPKERAKFRTKELERLLVSIEDAEGHMDRHNMMLFLLQDTLRKHPVGFEKRRKNIFDPADDDISQQGEDNEESEDAAKMYSEESNERNRKEETDSEAGKGEDTTNMDAVCARVGCGTKRRFDSLFCSDSCGVSSLEKDLLRTFQYASDIHPSLLRN